MTTALLPDHNTALPLNRIAVIDIGSNSLRLVVFERLGATLLPLLNEKVMCGLGRGISRTGRLNREGVALAYANLQRFVALARALNVDYLMAIATAAVRDASDGAKFAAEIERQCDLPVRIVAGPEEARLSAAGVLAGIPAADGVVGDLGGGSVELVRITGGVRDDRGAAIGEGISLPLGPLRLAEFADNPQAMHDVIRRGVASADLLRAAAGKPLFLVGGAWRAIARLHMEQAHYPLHIIHQYDIPADEARAVARLIAVQSAKSLEKMPGVSRRRVDTLPLACLALDRVLAALKPRNVVFSAFGLREGFYYQRLSEAERARHPLIAFAEEQGADWRRFDLSPNEIFDWLTPAFAGESDAERILRTAACHLSDISWNDHPDYRAEQAYIRVLHLPAPGMSHRDRAILAMTMTYRYKSDPKSAMIDTALKLSDSKGRTFARRLGASLRLAYNLSGGAPGLLPQIQLRRTERDLRLIVPPAQKRSLGDITARRLETAAEAFDLKSVIVSD